MCLLLSGCGAYDTREARIDLTGKPIEAVIQCAHIPDKIVKLDDNLGEAEWSYKETAPAFSLNLTLLGALTVGGGSTCVMAISFDKTGTIQSVRFPQCTGTLTGGPDATAGVLSGECLRRLGPAVSPAGYDAIGTLVPGSEPTKK